MAEFPESLVDAAETALRSATRVSHFSRDATVAVLRALVDHQPDHAPYIWREDLTEAANQLEAKTDVV